MSLFLVVTADPKLANSSQSIFESLVQAGQLLTGHAPASKHKTGNTQIAIFPRINGSSPKLVMDQETGNWLLPAGQWFHSSGYGCGSEEALLRRYLEIGAEQMHRELEGFFAIAHGNELTNEVSVLTDVIGSFHCFSRSWPGITAISSSSLLLASIGADSLDMEALAEFLGTGIIYENRSLHQSIRKLGPASRILYRNGRPQSAHRYWDLSAFASKPLSDAAALDSLHEELLVIGKRISSIYARPLCDLTGGFDSRALLASLLPSAMPLTTVVTGSEQSPDVQISRALAGLKGLPHIHLNPAMEGIVSEVTPVLPLTDGEYDAVEYSRVFKVHGTLSANFDISLNGSFGELARGYWWELLFPHLGDAKEIDAGKIARLRFAAGSFDSGLFSGKADFSLADHFTEVIKRTNKGLESAPNSLQMDNLYLMMRMQSWQGRIASSTDRIWPCLSPFIFRSVLEVILRTNPALRRRGLFVRKYLALFDRQLAEFPLEHGYPALPVSPGTLYRFWPIIPLYAGKVTRKILAKAGVQRSVHKTQSKTPARLRLWQDAKIRDTLDISTMKLASMLQYDHLRAFLEQSKQSAFGYDAQWARLLTVELALRRLEEIKCSIHQPLSER